MSDKDTVDWFDSLCSKIRGQIKSTEMWMGQFEKNGDLPSKRNAALALGKLSGMYQVLAEVADRYNLEIPQDIFKANASGQERWEKVSG